MKKNKLILYITTGLILSVITMASFVNANTVNQWFPEEETQIDYDISHDINFQNGTDDSTTNFDVYRSISASNFYLIPIQLRNYFTPSPVSGSLISLSNNTEVVYRVTYQNENSTHLSKLKTLVWDAGESNESMVTLTIYIFDSTVFTVTKTYVFTEEYVHRNDFPIATNVFLDFINKDLGIGDNLGMDGFIHENMAIVLLLLKI